MAVARASGSFRMRGEQFHYPITAIVGRASWLVGQSEDLAVDLGVDHVAIIDGVGRLPFDFA